MKGAAGPWSLLGTLPIIQQYFPAFHLKDKVLLQPGVLINLQLNSLTQGTKGWRHLMLTWIIQEIIFPLSSAICLRWWVCLGREVVERIFPLSNCSHRCLLFLFFSFFGYNSSQKNPKYYRVYIHLLPEFKLPPLLCSPRIFDINPLSYQRSL